MLRSTMAGPSQDGGTLVCTGEGGNARRITAHAPATIEPSGAHAHRLRPTEQSSRDYIHVHYTYTITCSQLRS